MFHTCRGNCYKYIFPASSFFFLAYCPTLRTFAHYSQVPQINYWPSFDFFHAHVMLLPRYMKVSTFSILFPSVIILLPMSFCTNAIIFVFSMLNGSSLQHFSLFKKTRTVLCLADHFCFLPWCSYQWYHWWTSSYWIAYPGTALPFISSSILSITLSKTKMKTVGDILCLSLDPLLALNHFPQLFTNCICSN